ncbi:glutathione S-transferase 1-like [Penaeus japonicus]|uniref:glutathione S-transferase 1-like n=1 Tax=Penaeus japonicus TaxID=27405 RepID=UPI001C71674B|nr:glutathione S-transferase 1-like [Penaeus japonicus]
MPLDLYYLDLSPPCRAVMLTARAVGVDLNLKVVNIMAGDHRKPEFLKVNPQHKVPFLVDGTVKLSESRAICSYLASQYGKDDSFYPNNPKARCIVDQRLYFDIGTLYQKWADFAYPGLRGLPVDQSLLEGIHEALSQFNANLMDFPWAAGNKITIADFSLVATISSMEAAGVDLQQHPHVAKWLRRCEMKMVGYKEANGDGASKFGEFLKNIIAPPSAAKKEEEKAEEKKEEKVEEKKEEKVEEKKVEEKKVEEKKVEIEIIEKENNAPVKKDDTSDSSSSDEE